MTYREKLKELHPDWDQTQLDAAYNRNCPDNYIEDADVPKYESGELWCGDSRCNECWDREISDTESLTYEHTTEPIGKVTEITEDEHGVTAKIEIDIKEEKTMATKKTKAELEKELEAVKESKAELEKELKNLEKYKQYEDAAGEIHALYTSFVIAGFSEEQAFDLTKTMIQNASNVTFNTNNASDYRGYRSYKR